jgi:insulysin
LRRLYADLVTDSLSEYSYAADLAGLSYSFVPSTLGIFLVISGYNDKLSVLLQHVLDRARQFKVSSDRLEVMREQTKQEWENFFLDRPQRVSDYYGRYLMNHGQWTFQQKLEALPCKWDYTWRLYGANYLVILAVTVDDVQNHIEKLLSSLHIKITLVGNTREYEAMALAEMIENSLYAAPLSEPEPVDQCLLMPEGTLATCFAYHCLIIT